MNSTSPSNRLRSTLTTRSRYCKLCRPGLLHPFALLAGLVDRADHVERLLGQVVVLALEDLGEAPHGLGYRHQLALAAGETLRHVVGLRQEPLDLARPRDGLLVVLRELLHAEDGDDVLQV